MKRSLLAVLAGATAAQAWQGPSPAYRAEMLACAAFREVAHTEVRASRGGPPIPEATDRLGVLRVQAESAAGGLHLAVWYDSLVVARELPGQRLIPETDGLVGGRWKGVLSPLGRVNLDTRPFMPPEILMVTDLSDHPVDFFPPLPDAALASGEQWTNGAGLTIERLADTAVGGNRLVVFAWRRDGVADRADAVRASERTEDVGRARWAADRGPVWWTRRIIVDTDVRAGFPSGEPLRGRIEQQVTVSRLPDGDCDMESCCRPS